MEINLHQVSFHLRKSRKLRQVGEWITWYGNYANTSLLTMFLSAKYCRLVTTLRYVHISSFYSKCSMIIANLHICFTSLQKLKTLATAINYADKMYNGFSYHGGSKAGRANKFLLDTFDRWAKLKLAPGPSDPHAVSAQHRDRLHVDSRANDSMLVPAYRAIQDT